MSELDKNTTVRVPLWAVLATAAAATTTGFGWLVTRFLDLQDQILELHEVIRELSQALGM